MVRSRVVVARKGAAHAAAILLSALLYALPFACSSDEHTSWKPCADPSVTEVSSALGACHLSNLFSPLSGDLHGGNASSCACTVRAEWLLGGGDEEESSRLTNPASKSIASLVALAEVRRCRLTSASPRVESPWFHLLESTVLSSHWFQTSTRTPTPRRVPPRRARMRAR